MRLVVVALTVLGASAVTLAVADPAAAPAATTTASTSATPASTAKPSDALSADEQSLISQGYKPKMHLGHKVFCRQEQAIGTRLTHGDTCGTVEELKARTQNARDATEASQRIQVNKNGS
jgi:hypothetical protein